MGRSPITYFYDEACTKRYPVNEEGKPIVDWGESIPGQKRKVELFAKNESQDRLIVRQPYTSDEDLVIKDYPASLMGLDKGKVVLELALNKDRIDSHNADWGFEVVVG